MALSGADHARILAYFHYMPSKGLAIAALCCYLLVAAASAWQNIR